MTPEHYARMPDTLSLREVRFRVSSPGVRCESLTVVTTLTDPEAYPKDQIAELFGHRWNVEICQPYCLQSERFYELPFRRLGTVRSAA